MPRLNLQALEEIMTLWCKRQEEGKTPFSFKAVDVKGKYRATAFNEDEDEDENEDDVNGNYDNNNNNNKENDEHVTSAMLVRCYIKVDRTVGN